jgi:hypothetical protein
MWSGHVTYKKGGHHGYEYNSIVIPECIHPEDKKAWINLIRRTSISWDKESYIQRKRVISLRKLRGESIAQ